ncbi:MAG: hypothetical protein ACK4SY_07690 [Pyrobaculum sp.]
MAVRRRKDWRTRRVRRLLEKAAGDLRELARELYAWRRGVRPEVRKELARVGDIDLELFEVRLHRLADAMERAYLDPALYRDREHVAKLVEMARDYVFNTSIKVGRAADAELERLKRAVDKAMGEIGGEIDNSPDGERLLGLWREAVEAAEEIKKIYPIDMWHIYQSTYPIASMMVALRRIMNVDDPLGKDRERVVAKGPLYAKMLKLYERLYASVGVIYVLYSIFSQLGEISALVAEIEDAIK